jgi:hypothetical protein
MTEWEAVTFASPKKQVTRKIICSSSILSSEQQDMLKTHIMLCIAEHNLDCQCNVSAESTCVGLVLFQVLAIKGKELAVTWFAFPKGYGSGTLTKKQGIIQPTYLQQSWSKRRRTHAATFSGQDCLSSIITP